MERWKFWSLLVGLFGLLVLSGLFVLFVMANPALPEVPASLGPARRLPAKSAVMNRYLKGKGFAAPLTTGDRKRWLRVKQDLKDGKWLSKPADVRRLLLSSQSELKRWKTMVATGSCLPLAEHLYLVTPRTQDYPSWKKGALFWLAEKVLWLQSGKAAKAAGELLWFQKTLHTMEQGCPQDSMTMKVLVDVQRALLKVMTLALLQPSVSKETKLKILHWWRRRAGVDKKVLRRVIRAEWKNAGTMAKVLKNNRPYSGSLLNQLGFSARWPSLDRKELLVLLRARLFCSYKLTTFPVYKLPSRRQFCASSVYYWKLSWQPLWLQRFRWNPVGKTLFLMGMDLQYYGVEWQQNRCLAAVLHQRARRMFRARGMSSFPNDFDRPLLNPMTGRGFSATSSLKRGSKACVLPHLTQMVLPEIKLPVWGKPPPP